MWKSGNDKVAEYDPAFDKDTQYYGNFAGRTKLNLTSGSITISDLTDEDNGEFSVEVNNMQQSVKFSLKVIRKFIFCLCQGMYANVMLKQHSCQ